MDTKLRSFMPYEVPLRPGVTARVVLPVDLTAEEAERLCEVIRSLAFSDEADDTGISGALY
jgi:hypothetical protein